MEPLPGSRESRLDPPSTLSDEKQRGLPIIALARDGSLVVRKRFIWILTRLRTPARDFTTTISFSCPVYEQF